MKFLVSRSELIWFTRYWWLWWSLLDFIIHTDSNFLSAIETIWYREWRTIILSIVSYNVNIKHWMNNQTKWFHIYDCMQFSQEYLPLVCCNSTSGLFAEWKVSCWRRSWRLPLTLKARKCWHFDRWNLLRVWVTVKKVIPTKFLATFFFFASRYFSKTSATPRHRGIARRTIESPKPNRTGKENNSFGYSHDDDDDGIMHLKLSFFFYFSLWLWWWTRRAASDWESDTRSRTLNGLSATFYANVSLALSKNIMLFFPQVDR